MPNIEAKVNEAVRVANEVAAMVLMRSALSAYPRKLVPDVYGWNGDGDGQHWILEEAMPGVPKAKEFKNRPIEEQRHVFAQMAEIFKLIQDYEVPCTVKGFGGLGFDKEGNVVTGSMTMPYGGPFPSMDALYGGILEYQLAEADRSELVKGWRTTGLRERLDKFAAHGIDELLRKLPADRQTLIHGDYSEPTPFPSFLSPLPSPSQTATHASPTLNYSSNALALHTQTSRTSSSTKPPSKSPPS